MRHAALITLSILLSCYITKATLSLTTSFPSNSELNSTSTPASLSNESSTSKQSPKGLLLEFLLQLMQQTDAYNRDANDTRQNLTDGPPRIKFPPATSAPPPSPRAEAEYTSTPTTLILSCDYERGRNECGYPGITPEECRNKRCCWNHETNDIFWCFQPRRIAVSSNQTRQRSAELGSTPRSVEAVDETTSSTVDPLEHLNTSPPTLNTILSPNPTTTPQSTFSPEERSFLSAIQDELMIIQSNISLPLIFNQQTTASTPLQTQQLTRVITTTSEATTTTQINMPHHENQEQTQTNQSQGTFLSTWNYLSGLQELAALLKFVEELERARARPSTTPTQARTCKLSNDDSCCRIDPSSPCCGFQEQTPLVLRAAPVTRIVGGSPAGTLRHSVAHLSRGPLRRHFCGGTLIYNKWVLTAAHCVLEFCYNSRSASEITVSLGKYHKAPFTRNRGQQDISVSDVICHPNQCKSSADKPRINDVALLRLSKSAITSQFVSPALLPEPLEQPSLITNCIAMGWGSTRGSGFSNVLKQVSVPLVSNQKCNLPGWRNCIVKSCMLCAGDVNIDPCNGDSGGPLFCPRPNGVYVLHGVYSWGRCGADRMRPSIYMRSSPYVDWISRTVQSFRTNATS